MFFFFKQKTAYEMRISDWSSDVCSYDLIMMALRARDQGGAGQMIDVALHESVFNMMESLLPEYSVFGEVRQAAGSSLPGIAPSNAYRCKGDKFVLIAGNGDKIGRASCRERVCHYV